MKTRIAYQIRLLTKRGLVIPTYIKGTFVKQQFYDLLQSN